MDVAWASNALVWLEGDKYIELKIKFLESNIRLTNNCSTVRTGKGTW